MGRGVGFLLDGWIVCCDLHFYRCAFGHGMGMEVIEEWLLYVFMIHPSKLSLFPSFYKYGSSFIVPSNVSMQWPLL